MAALLTNSTRSGKAVLGRHTDLAYVDVRAEIRGHAWEAGAGKAVWSGSPCVRPCSCSQSWY